MLLFSIVGLPVVVLCICKVVAPCGFVKCFSVRVRLVFFGRVRCCVLLCPFGADVRRASGAMRGGGGRLVFLYGLCYIVWKVRFLFKVGGYFYGETSEDVEA